MFKYIAPLILAVSSVTASAQWHHHYSPCCYRGPGIGWVAPAVIGGVIGYEVARSQPIIAQPTVTVQPVVLTDPNIVIVDGVIYRKVMMQVNGAYQEVLVKP